MAFKTNKLNAFIAKMDATTAGLSAKLVSKSVTASDGKAILASIDQASKDVVKVYSGLKKVFATKQFLSTAGKTAESKAVATALASLSNLGTRIDFLKTIADDEFGEDAPMDDADSDVSADDVLDGISKDTGVSFEDLTQTLDTLQDQITDVKNQVADQVDDPALLGDDTTVDEPSDAPATVDVVSAVTDPDVKKIADEIKNEIKQEVVDAELTAGKKPIVAKKVPVPTTKTSAGSTPSIGLFGSFLKTK